MTRDKKLAIWAAFFGFMAWIALATVPMLWMVYWPSVILCWVFFFWSDRVERKQHAQRISRRS